LLQSALRFAPTNSISTNGPQRTTSALYQDLVYGGAAVAINATLRAIRPDGSPVRFPSIRVDGFGAQSGRFLPNGKGMIYRTGPDFWLLDLSTLVTRQLTRFSKPSLIKTFDITPDGKQIVFDRLHRNSDIYLIDLPPKQ